MGNDKEKKLELMLSILQRRVDNTLNPDGDKTVVVNICNDMTDVRRTNLRGDKLEKLVKENNYICLAAIWCSYSNHGEPGGTLYVHGTCIGKGSTKIECARNALQSKSIESPEYKKYEKQIHSL